MLNLHRRALLSIGVAALLGCVGRANGASICDPDGEQESGSLYRICMPDPQRYNNNLVIWAHGFQDAGTPVEIPEDQLTFGGTSIPEIVNGLGFGFATNSYSKTGLAVRQGMADILDLVQIYAQEKGPPQNVYLTGASEGGIITALLVEQNPSVFRAGLAACGPVGDFPYQLNYFGDARATFEYFFPGLIPGDPFHPPQTLIDNWATHYEEVVKPVVLDPANRHLLNQWVRVARLPFDADNYLETAEISMRDVLRYAVININDAAETLGGFPYGNTRRWYRGSDDDLRLNLEVARVAADPAAIAEMENFYNTTGELESPLVTMHTRRDQQVPYFHETLYNLKTLASGSYLTEHLNIPIDRYEHCNFTPGEALFAFAAMLYYAGDVDLLSIPAWEQLARDHGLPGLADLDSPTDGVIPIPEPTTFVLIGWGLLGLVGRPWNRRRSR